MSEKRCANCERTKPVEQFDVRRRNPDGTARTWHSYCKPCKRAADRYASGMRRRGRPYLRKIPGMTPEEKAATARDRYNQRRDEINAARRARYALDEAHRRKLQAQNAARERTRMKNDPAYYEKRRAQMAESNRRHRARKKEERDAREK